MKSLIRQVCGRVLLRQIVSSNRSTCPTQVGLPAIPIPCINNLTSCYSQHTSSSRPPSVQSVVSTFTEEEKLSLVQAEYELYQLEDEINLPSKVTDRQWADLVKLPSVMGRKKYFQFLFINQVKSENEKKRKLERKKINQEKYELRCKELAKDNHIVYGLWNNTMFIKYTDTWINSIDTFRVMQAKMFGQPIVIDYGFDDHMVSREKSLLAKQMRECFGLNRINSEPYDLHLCNFRQQEETAQLTMRGIPTLLNDEYPVECHEKDYLDVFPKEKLVYLTPHCREEMTTYDHDAIYIIGGLIDTRNSEPLTLAKAKKQNIRMQKLPLDRYLDWGMGKKTLPLNHILGILLEMKKTGDWMTAFEKHIPRRKLIKHEYGDSYSIKKKMRQQKLDHRRLIRDIYKD